MPDFMTRRNILHFTGAGAAGLLVGTEVCSTCAAGGARGTPSNELRSRRGHLRRFLGNKLTSKGLCEGRLLQPVEKVGCFGRVGSQVVY